MLVMGLSLGGRDSVQDFICLMYHEAHSHGNWLEGNADVIIVSGL